MSVADARQFIERMKTDEEYRIKIMMMEDIAGRLQLANAEGYTVNVNDIIEVMDELDANKFAESPLGASVTTYFCRIGSKACCFGS